MEAPDDASNDHLTIGQPPSFELLTVQYSSGRSDLQSQIASDMYDKSENIGLIHQGKMAERLRRCV